MDLNILVRFSKFYNSMECLDRKYTDYNLLANSTPTVGRELLSNVSFLNLCISADFPTSESPMNMTRKRGYL